MMEEIKFDMKQIMQTQMDKTALRMFTSISAKANGVSVNTNMFQDIMMVFINKGIPLTTALDIMMEIVKITSKMQGGEEKDG